MAAVVVVFELTRSTVLVAMVSIAQFGPQMLLTPWLGATADTGNRRLQLMVGRTISAVGACGIAIYSEVLGLEELSGAIAVIVGALVVGVGFAVGAPAMHALLPDLVPLNDLPTAISWSTFTATIARTVGPAVGAFLAIGVSHGLAFLLAGIAQLCFVAALWLFVDDLGKRQVAAGGSVLDGVRFLRGSPRIAVALLGVTAVSFASDPALTLTPALAVQVTGDTAFAGTLASAFGLGSALAFLVVVRMQRKWGYRLVSVVGVVLLASSALALALVAAAVSALAAFATGGVGLTLALVSLTTIIQRHVSPDFRGRVMAIWTVGFLGARPLAASVTGVISDVFSVQAALVVVGLVSFVVAGGMAASPSLGERGS